MSGNEGLSARILGSLRSADGVGVVRIEDRFDTTMEDLWEALTDPGRLARWYGRVEGDLRPGGRFRTYVEANEIEARGRVEVCEPPQRLLLTTRETDESYQRGRGVPPYDDDIEARWDELVPPYQALAATIDCSDYGRRAVWRRPQEPSDPTTQMARAPLSAATARRDAWAPRRRASTQLPRGRPGEWEGSPPRRRTWCR